MKKSIIFSLFSAVFAMSASAEYYTVPAAGEVFTSELSSSITSTGGMQGGQMTFQFSSTKTVATITSDFVFENHVYLENTTTDTASTNENMYHATFYINEGAELTFNQVTFDAPIKTRFGLYSTSGERGSVVFNEAVTITGGVSKGSAEYWLKNVDVTVSSSKGSNYMGLSHILDGTTITAKNTTFTIGNIYLRTSTKKTESGTKDAGKIIAENSKVIVSGLGNANKITADFEFNFATDAKEEFDFNIKLSSWTANANTISVYFTNMGADDRIYSIEKLETLSNLKINGATISSLIEAGLISVETVMKDGVASDYIYTYIPEPATYAGILGALAIAFAFMRRQPRK